MRRDAIIEAAIRVVGSKGYRATTVADIIAAAGVARTTFYKHFADKHECFLAACELTAERAIAAVEAGCGRAGEEPERDEPRSWTERVGAGLASLVETLAADSALARTLVVEAPLAGAEARRRQLATIERFTGMLEAGRPRGESDGGIALPTSTGLMAIGAVAGLLFDEIQAGRATELRQRLPDLLFALLVPYLGPRRAAEEARSAESYAASR